MEEDHPSDDDMYETSDEEKATEQKQEHPSDDDMYDSEPRAEENSGESKEEKQREEKRSSMLTRHSDELFARVLYERDIYNALRESQGGVVLGNGGEEKKNQISQEMQNFETELDPPIMEDNLAFARTLVTDDYDLQTWIEEHINTFYDDELEIWIREDPDINSYYDQIREELALEDQRQQQEDERNLELAIRVSLQQNLNWDSLPGANFYPPVA
jgi:hypothetical protein